MKKFRYTRDFPSCSRWAAIAFQVSPAESVPSRSDATIIPEFMLPELDPFTCSAPSPIHVLGTIASVHLETQTILPASSLISTCQTCVLRPL